MLTELPMIPRVIASLILAFLITFLLSPLVKSFAYKVGAIDVPKDKRRMHSTPIPRLGGLGIFVGFLFTILLFEPMTEQTKGILLGAIVIVILGVVDDITPLNALFKFCVQIVAALIPVLCGVRISVLSNPNIFSNNPWWTLQGLSIPITVFWIVAITNSVNIIDGLDGLAAGVSAISSATFLAIALHIPEPTVSVSCAALLGACAGFLPYNLNPAKMFMGDTGSTFLGYILATISIQGMFKMYAIVSFFVPFLVLGLPLFDITFAVLRRLAHGQNPMKADRGHVHHRLIDMGLNQKQAVATLYIVTTFLGLGAVVLTTSGAVKALIVLAALFVVGLVTFRILFSRELESTEEKHRQQEKEDTAKGENENA